jgi:hypothetical protein
VGAIALLRRGKAGESSGLSACDPVAACDRHRLHNPGGVRNGALIGLGWSTCIPLPTSHSS